LFAFLKWKKYITFSKQVDKTKNAEATRTIVAPVAVPQKKEQISPITPETLLTITAASKYAEYSARYYAKWLGQHEQ